MPRKSTRYSARAATPARARGKDRRPARVLCPRTRLHRPLPYLEFLHGVAGDATIAGDDGEVHEVSPGVAVTLRAGWTGRWTVREEIRVTVARVYCP